MVNGWNIGDDHARINNGESPAELQARQKVAVHHIMNQEQEKNILICMHGRAMKSLLCLLLNKPLKEMEDFQHTNLCLYVLEYDNQQFRLLKQNDTMHLQTKAV
jgi:probable phosphoglycerate mutase